MKKAKYLLVLVSVLFLTGCVKMNANMKINKDKSMNYEVIIAMAKDLVTDKNTILSEDQKKQAKKNGYTISDYKDDDMIGYKVVKKIKNIDSISTTKKVESNLDVDSKDKYMFTVKKGFFKNTYKATLTTNSTDSLNSQMGDSSTTTDDDGVTLESSDVDYSSYMSNMDFKFEVKLPYKAKKNNATTVEDNGKTLSWNLFEVKDKIEFEFEIYNLTNVYITVGIAVIAIVAIVLFILKKRKTNE